ncbi:hypothetical protein AVEN_182112-1 [Araneus ventricosus]|uniref:Uncharacterized protein n=1 Tax=Araneus ventricosus TaxID=182803 RepID=A0A4Y2U5B8_ARAVE|nr:hypothetical protein AVEN_182112-1 [Araneus ventricosus]
MSYWLATLRTTIYEQVPVKDGGKLDQLSNLSLFLLYLRPFLLQQGGYFKTDRVILNHGQMARITPDLGSSRTSSERGYLAISFCNSPIHGSGIGFPAWNLPAQSRDPTTRPPQP